MLLRRLSASRAPAARVVFACGVAHLFVTSCAAALEESQDPVPNLDAWADAVTGSVASAESACLLQRDASAGRAAARAPSSAVLDRTGKEGELPKPEHAVHTIDTQNDVKLNSSGDNDTTSVAHATVPDERSTLMEIRRAAGIVNVSGQLAEPVKLQDGPEKTGNKKSKVVLMILEMVPLCGPLGIDRFYLGAVHTALAKLIVCICTCLVGGLVWGLLDAIIVIVNALTRKSSIDTMGLHAEFSEDEIEPAHTLAVIGVVVQAFFCCGGPRFLSFVHARLTGKREAPPTAMPTSGPGASILSQTRQ